jgi:hypothetical protein
MTSPMPSSVVVGPVTYRITASEDDWRANLLEEGTEHRGMFGRLKEGNALILLQPTYDIQVQRVTLLHEILHAVTTGHRKGKLSEERWVSLIDALLLDVLRRNPELVAWLLEVER